VHSQLGWNDPRRSGVVQVRRRRIWLGTQQDSRRIKNLKKNPNVTLVVDVDQPPYKGVVIYGKAQLDYENVIAKRISIFEKYMPKANAEKLADGLASMRKPVIIRVKPSKMVSYDYGKDQSGMFK
jgi:hypothetical protein